MQKSSKLKKKEHEHFLDINSLISPSVHKKKFEGVLENYYSCMTTGNVAVLKSS